MPLNAEEFGDVMKGGLQLQLNGGEALIDGESDMFVGSTVQLNNVLDAFGNSQGDSTLGRTVTKIFNNEFLLEPFDLLRQRGVPLTRIDLSGYGASTFSNWLNPTAAFAQTSQARFDVFVGRCAHEVIQVKSIIYPWGIKVVRTITIFRVGSGYVYEVNSGWRAESSGEFDFRYWVNVIPTDKVEKESPFSIHPGIIKGLFNVQNIVETDTIAPVAGQMVSSNIVNEDGLYVPNPAAGDALGFELQPVYFDADVEIENVVSGFTTKKIAGSDKKVVPSKKILGYVQVAPRGIPISSATLRDLIVLQAGSIGGPINCEIDLAGAGQKMRLNRFDANNSFGANGSDIVFALAGRGNVLLPKDGSWTMVKHERDSGEVSPVPANLSVPVIRQGRLIKDNAGQKLDTPIQNVLLRVADPADLLRAPVDDTVNYGFLQSTDTQKALFLTPAFEIGKKQLFSKTPPLFVDAFRIVNSKAIFPNIGNAENNLGDAISLITNGTEFSEGSPERHRQGRLVADGHHGVGRQRRRAGLSPSQAGSHFRPAEQGLRTDRCRGWELPHLHRVRTKRRGRQPASEGRSRLQHRFHGRQRGGHLEEPDGQHWHRRRSRRYRPPDDHPRQLGLEKRFRGRLPAARSAIRRRAPANRRHSRNPATTPGRGLRRRRGNGLKLAMSNKAGTWEYKFEASKEIPVLQFPGPRLRLQRSRTPHSSSRLA